ncbi:cytidylyltransferase domain-containing protein [Psychrobacillus sp. NPDC096623]|uniref:acylneuraminate cytidylyltransferase family protein n=1 Tax=Psychrobacillus sp. NPDC096623 TaxID=3364492 RepID=UPI00381C10EA
MINDKKLLAVIPARGGSKGIPGKNIIPVNGKPLIQYTIDTAKNSKYIDEIHVSTDDSKIAAVSEKCGIKVPRLRPNHLAQDDSKSIEVLIDTIQYYQTIGRTFDYVILLQPTQPLRQTFHIDEAIELIYKKRATSLVSVSIVHEHPILMRQIDSTGNLVSLIKTNSTVRRQELPSFYIVNGAIYINEINDIFNLNTSLNDNILPYIMDEKYHVDIDGYEDLQEFERKLNLI